MVRVAAVIVVLTLAAAPVLAQRYRDADFVEQALSGCHDGTHAISEPEVEHQSISFRAGPREVRVFLLGNVGIDYAEQGSPGRSHRRDARLTLTCANTVACVWSGAWDAELAAARAEHGIVLLSALGLGNQSLVLYCPDTRAAQALQRSLRVFQRSAPH
jgi:hypothetical protein